MSGFAGGDIFLLPHQESISARLIAVQVNESIDPVNKTDTYKIQSAL
jgi:hypothetical protein